VSTNAAQALRRRLDINGRRHHDASVRTTLTLERDVAERLQKDVRRTGKSLKAVVNEALRLGLGLAGKPRTLPRYTVRPHSFGFGPGVDLDRLNQLADELEVEETVRTLRR
jgi:hypothetical protein